MIERSVRLFQAAAQERQSRFDASLLSGQYRPFLYPWDSLSALVLFVALVFLPDLPRTARHVASLATFGLVLWMCLDVVRNARSMLFAGGYGIGLMCAWGSIIILSLLVMSNPRTDFIRLEKDQEESLSSTREKEASAVVSSIEQWNDQNDVVQTGISQRPVSKSLDAKTCVGAKREQCIASSRLSWQRLPVSLIGRLDWTLDLLTSFRGCNWNFRAPSSTTMLAPRPSQGMKVSTAFSFADERSSRPKPTLTSIQLKALRNFVLLYLLTDFLKTIMMTDIYFAALNPISAPSPWLPAPLHVRLPALAGIISKVMRLSVSLAGLITTLSLDFSLCPLFFTAILPKLLPALHRLTRTPMLEPDMYPAYWASPIGALGSRTSALASIWSKCWHQMFRFGIYRPSEQIISYFNISPRSYVARLLVLFIGFALTGSIHAGAASTSFPANPSTPQRPFKGAFLFFILQPFGILFQTFINTNILHTKSWPPVLLGAYNTTFLLLWSYNIGPLLVDDFAKCGIWMYEPVPISVFRPLLLGQYGERSLRWVFWGQDKQAWIGWWRGDTIWNTGLAVY